MRILVTGGFGFLGSHLLDLLLNSPDNQVHVVDNLSTSPLPQDRLLSELKPKGKLTYSIMDVADWFRGRDLGKFDQVYHLASVVGPAGVLNHAGRISSSIVGDCITIADYAMKTGAKVVDVSTSEIYGGGRDGLCSEDMPKIVPAKTSARLEYAVGKLAAEVSVMNLCATKGLNAVIVRPFNITGPRQSGRGGFVLPRFIGQAMAGADLTVFGTGQQVRAFTHVRDMADGILRAMELGTPGAVYNLGNPQNRCTIQQLAEEVIRTTGSRSRIIHVDPKAIYGPFYEEANDKYPESSKATAELGWDSKFSRIQTISDTWAYMKDLPQDLLRTIRGF